MERNNTPELETKRLILRKFSVQDTEALFSLYSDEEINTYLPWFPLRSLEEARTYRRKNMQKFTGFPADINTPSA